MTHQIHSATRKSWREVVLIQIEQTKSEREIAHVKSSTKARCKRCQLASPAPDANPAG